MTARKINLKTHADDVVGRATETKAVIVGVLTSGSPQCPITHDDMQQSKPILEAIRDRAVTCDYILISEEQWTFLVTKIKTFPYATGGLGMIAAKDDVLDAVVVSMDERDTNP